MSENGFIAPLIGALQACVSVLLTMSYGVLARRLKLIREQSINDMGALGVKLFLPALLIINLGKQLHLGSAMNYLPVLAWSATYTVTSIGFGHILSRTFKLPPWVTPACTFNNTTSLPLLLLQSLESVGSLKMILQGKDTMHDAIERAQSYFLVCAVVSKTVGYVVGPRMLYSNDGEEDAYFEQHQNGASEEPDSPRSQGQVDEETSLLPERAQVARSKVGNRMKTFGGYISSFFPTRVKKELMAPFESPSADVTILCALTGVLIGLLPPLHKAFFNHYMEGGVLNAWLTSSIKNIGMLFTTLQIFIVGCKLGVSLERMRASSGSGKIPVTAIVTIFLIRLVVWPAISIPVIYGLAKKTNLVQDDPILWFSMMLMPAGPPALIISGLAELAKISEVERMAIAKTLM
ncbi:Auxin Efflux Carrier superfamily [Aspergillus sclerotialis]|uniref:Auxin Efflux Carrier superfamily n=1 Tax=Aspergillus sclerotialis TaxID=2070753 RepID=A0A3A2ZNY4_9EURO|nr:Auxin Efflux Carrier superfamily [Aspergillus sclerotialis]